ncbi:MAG: glycosyltransferase family 39 protein, partial [Pseudomonadota bacterium]
MSQGFLLALIICALSLPGLWQMPTLDRDEARFAQATKQMLETGDALRIRFQGKERNKKPHGIHWLQAISVRVLSADHPTNIWAYRVPSVLGLALAVFGVWALGGHLADRETGWRAALLFGAGPVAMASVFAIVASAMA